MPPKKYFKEYFQTLSDISQTGDAREESYYPALSSMFEAMVAAEQKGNIKVRTLPKKTDAGNPDFRLWNGNDRIIGYIEAKHPSEEMLDLIEDSEQLRRYRATFPNLILTNFLEFRLYRDGQLVDSVLAARPVVLNQLRMSPPVEKPDELHALLNRFLDFSLPRVFSAESLAVELAKRTRFMRDVVARLLDEESAAPGVLTGFYEAFKKFLIGALTAGDFADLYSQTITYGLFTARIRAGEAFNRRAAFDNIPHTIGVLRDLFRFISLGDLPDQLAWCVDDISEVLAVADASGILNRYYREGKGGDPIVHFYETFLAQYDPAERERRGVYYTPEPVVSYIVRSLHQLLKTEFGKPDGLASDGVTLLDPAAGTMTFVARAAREAVHEFESKYGSGARDDFIRQHILKNFYAFELMMAPYAVGHLKMSFFLEELGHRLADNERMRFYLTNTLDIEELEQSHMPFYSALAEESRLAGEVKKQTPVLVILGNPPYSGHSSNKSDWISGLIGSYKQVDGKPLGEKNSKWIQNDYVKFLRFAQWKIERAGQGIVGMITDHGYLKNPTFRGMRQSLMQTFDEIYVLDLHGGSKEKERCPDGSKDENVFDIQQGVSIAFFIKHAGKRQATVTVYHSALWGDRQNKYNELSTQNIGSTVWDKLNPISALYLFVPQDTSFMERFICFSSIKDIFEIEGSGIITKRDGLTIGYTESEIWKKVKLFVSLQPELARSTFELPADVRDWSVQKAKEDINLTGLNIDFVKPILYRPFDIRFTYYTGNTRGFLGWPVKTVMRHMLEGDNFALIIPKRVEHSGSWQHAFACNLISDHVSVSLKTVDYHFPLYLYPDSSKVDLFTAHSPAERRPNLNPKLFAALSQAYGREPAPEEIFYYVYAVLYAPSYREKYAEFLRMDFPRIPFTSDAELLTGLAGLGKRLVELHLLRSTELESSVCRFPVEGDCHVARGRKDGLRYVPDEQRVYINKSQYFAPVPREVWDYRVGGYQVCDKWLKDRVERRLEVSDIRTYCRIVTSLALTLDIQDEIDELYERAESAIIPLSGLL